MLRDLNVRNLAIIVDVSISFDAGLNVLTGETGAGKSIVVDSLALLSGVRASSELIRSGAETLSVTGVFEPRGEGWRGLLAEAGVDCETDELVVRREITREGRNRVFLNDQLVTLGLLATLAPRLIRIHTQREELGLVSPELQRSWLDRSGGDEAGDHVAKVEGAFARYRTLADRLERLQGDEQVRHERLELLQFQCSEIDAARLRGGEDDDLRVERDLLRHSEAIREALSTSFGVLFEEEGAATDRMALAGRRLAAIAEWEPRCRDWLAELESASVGVTEVAREIGQRLDEADADPARLDEVEGRLAVIERLCRKYGATAADVVEHRAALGRELEELSGGAAQREQLEQQVDEALSRYRELASELSERRRDWAVALVDRVHDELADLALAKARFGVELGIRRRDSSPLRIDGESVEFGAAGFDQVTYQLAANPGEQMSVLSRSASGGELSRVYLALQLAIRAGGRAARPTLVFDEVDAGIGGAEAAALGHKLARLAAGGQILAVTHLPQVASHADHHFRVEKEQVEGRTLTTVARLDRSSRVREVARMLAGQEVTDLSLSHAAEMIDNAGRPLA